MNARYYVYYGAHNSRQSCYTLNEVRDFISYCLKNNVQVREVTKA